MSDLLLYKNPYIFDRLMELDIDYNEAISMYSVGFLAHTGGGINRVDSGIFRIPSSTLIPNYTITKSFSEIMHQRAENLAANHESFKIRWKGLTSSTIIKSLLNFTNKIEIITNLENKQYIPQEFNSLKVKVVDNEYFTMMENDEVVYLSDECGSCLFTIRKNGWKIGNYQSPSKRIDSSINLNSETLNTIALGIKYAKSFESCKAIKYYYNDINKAYKNIYTYFEKLIAQSPIPIKTNFDFYWWTEFCMRWNAMKWKCLGLNGKHINNIDFFDSDDFQAWSIQNHETKGRHTMVDFLGYNIPQFDEKTISLRDIVEINGQKTTWKISFADSEGNIATEPEPVTKEMVKRIIKSEITV